MLIDKKKGSIRSIYCCRNKRKEEAAILKQFSDRRTTRIS